MSLQPSLTPYLRSLSVKNVRTFAAAAAKTKDAPRSDSSYKPREDVRTTTVDNNITVSSVETNKPVSKLAIYFKAGSRFETDESRGAAQSLRICAGLGTTGASQFGITRNIDFAGGNFYCTAGREHIAYTIEAARDKIQNLEPYLQDATLNQAFKPWEISDNLPRLKLDRATRTPEIRILDLIHKAAYRKGLGYSMYSPKWMVGNHSTEMLLEYVSKNFCEASVVAVGLPHERVLDFVARLNIKSGNRQVKPSKFIAGSEIRKESASSLAYVALAIEGGSLLKPKDTVTSALVQRALGSGPRTKRGVNAGGKLTAAVGDSADNASVTAFSVNYSDSGLLGVVIASTPCSVDTVTRKATEVLKGASFSEEDVSRAKSQLKSDIALATESDDGMLEEMGLQSLQSRKVASPGEINGLIDSVTAADLNALIKKGKLSVASYGNIAKVPYLDELK